MLNFHNNERSQNTVLLASTHAVYKAPHSTVRRTHRTDTDTDRHFTVTLRLRHMYTQQ